MSVRGIADLNREAPASASGNPDTQGLWNRLAEAGQVQEYCVAWLALQCRQIEGVGAALLVMEEGTNAFVPAAVWPDPASDVTYLGEAARICLTEKRGRVIEAPEHAGRVFVGYPIEIEGRLCGAVVLDLSIRSETELQEVLRALHWGAGRLEVVFQRRQLAQAAAAGERAQIALDLAALVGEQAGLEDAAMALANELSVRLGCERVAVGLERRGRIRLRAISHAAWFEKKGEFVIALENAMEEAVDQHRSVVHPALLRNGNAQSNARSIAQGSAIAVAHRDLGGESAACSVVLATRGREMGAITCVRRGGIDADMLAQLEAIAALAAPHLEARRELARWFAGAFAERVRRFARDLADPRRPGLPLIAVLAAAGIVFLALADGEYRVSAKAAIEGEVQRAVVAPFDGFVAAAAVRAGQRVVAGQVLARLDERDLRLERQKWFSEREQAERKYRDALAKHERTNARILSEQLAEADAQLDLVDEKLARTSLIAPFDAVVVSGDLSQMLGSPVEKGKVLFEVAPLDAYRVILKVEEEDIRGVTAGQHGQLMLAGSAGQAMPFVVKNISVASAEDGKNLFRVEAQLEGAVPALRPGMEGVGKVIVGERRLIWIWTHAFFDWLRLKLWRWLP